MSILNKWNVFCFHCKEFQRIWKQSVSRKTVRKLKKWMKSINNRIYWTAAGSTSKPERIAMWTAILNHVRDVRTHEDPLYSKCEHAIRKTTDKSKWFLAVISSIYRLNVKTVNRQLHIVISHCGVGGWFSGICSGREAWETSGE